jgi:hypothetical protein
LGCRAQAGQHRRADPSTATKSAQTGLSGIDWPWLLVDLREAGKVTRLAELIHRAIPYPVLLILAAVTV